MGSNGKLAYSTTTEAARVAEYLTRIADGLRQGTIDLSSAGQTLRLEPPGIIRLDMEAKARPGNEACSLELEISWESVRRGALELVTASEKS